MDIIKEIFVEIIEVKMSTKNIYIAAKQKKNSKTCKVTL